MQCHAPRNQRAREYAAASTWDLPQGHAPLFFPPHVEIHDQKTSTHHSYLHLNGVKEPTGEIYSTEGSVVWKEPSSHIHPNKQPSREGETEAEANSARSQEQNARLLQGD